MMFHCKELNSVFSVLENVLVVTVTKVQIFFPVSSGDEMGLGEGHEKAETEIQEKVQSKQDGKNEEDTDSDDKEKDEKETEDKSKDETVPQDYGFTVMIRPPAGEPFELQVFKLFH